MKKKLPIGIQTFKKIRDGNYTYVDKTAIAFRLIDSGSYYFISRPRRFGKSLFLDTLAEIFQGSQSLFKGLYIDDKWDWNTTYPVVRIAFDTGDFSTDNGINARIQEIFQDNIENLELNLPEDVSFAQLLKLIYEKYNQQVVILIDEYDKPILDNITDVKQATSARNILRNLYGTIKGSDRYIRFVFITGVSKFSKMNLFSGLNNLKDITIDKNYANIAGYTQNDLETVFAEHLQTADMAQVKRWYNGYNWFGDPLYNPFDILLFISEDCEFENYWWGSGNPAFLIDKIKETKFYIPDFENIEIARESLDAFDVEKIELIALLWQTGYLTFAKKLKFPGRTIYRMKIPNIEIQASLNELCLQYLTGLNGSLGNREVTAAEAILEHNPDKLNQSLTALFASIPYSNYVKNIIAEYEGYYASIIYSFFSALGYDVVAEDITNRGRIDLTVQSDDALFILEFKVDCNEPAIKQIKERRYYEKYLSDRKRIFIIGINFSSEERNIKEFQWEALKNRLCRN